MSEFSVSRSAFIPASPEAVFAHVNDFRAWSGWSPWEDLDVDLKKVYSGAEAGVGAQFAWSGRKSGAGTMEITKSVSPTADPGGTGRIEIDLRFAKPIKAHNQTTFTFVPEEDGTHVSWEMSGENKTLFARVFARILNMDKAVGGDFEKGLARLRGVLAEAG